MHRPVMKPRGLAHIGNGEGAEDECGADDEGVGEESRDANEEEGYPRRGRERSMNSSM